jgi:hypothetical protein
MKNISATNGTSRHDTFLIADRSTDCVCTTFMSPPGVAHECGQLV